MDYEFLDTNIFIEVFARSGFKSDKSRFLVQKRVNLFTTDIVISEIEWVLRTVYLLSREKIAVCIKKILSSNNIEIKNRPILIETVVFYGKNNVDWTDCINMFLIKDLNISKVYSYDKGLNKFDWIKRLEP